MKASRICQDRTLNIAKMLLGHNPLSVFAENYRRTATDWLVVLRQTIVPHDIESTDTRITQAFVVLDNVIVRGLGTTLLRRLAYIQLIRVFESLERLLQKEREDCRSYRRRCYTDRTVALDIYMSSQSDISNVKRLRRDLKERKRIGRRWLELAVRTSPVFVLVYPETAEKIVKDFKNINSASLKTVATHILRTCPQQLIKTCNHLEGRIESSIIDYDLES
ncbi:hypothetical protein V8F33_001718 [Rhypophila sp. PSN 637]